MKGIITISALAAVFMAVLAAGCASQAAPADGELFPPRIQSWIDANQDTMYYGIGVSSIDGDESFAMRESATIAVGELTRNLEAKVATVNTNIAQRGGGGKAVEATKQTASMVLGGAKTLGPVKGDGKIYTIKYISIEDFDNREKNAIKQAEVNITEAELNQLLDSLH
jgi:hypothetical protein